MRGSQYVCEIRRVRRTIRILIAKTRIFCYFYLMKIYWEVSGVLTSPHGALRPYAKAAIRFLESVGIENHLWSKSGRNSVTAVAGQLGLGEDRVASKPCSPEELQEAAFPSPTLVVDTDPSEYVTAFPHLIVPAYSGKTGDRELLKVLPKVRDHLDTADPDTENLTELKIKWRRKRRPSASVRARRHRSYRKNRSYYKKYKRLYKRRPRTKRLMKVRKRLLRRFTTKRRRYRVRITV